MIQFTLHITSSHIRVSNPSDRAKLSSKENWELWSSAEQPCVEVETSIMMKKGRKMK